MQAQSSFIAKAFQLCDQLTSKLHTFSIQVPYLPATREINLSRAISNISSSGFNLNNCHIFYLDVIRKLYVHIGCFPFKQEILLKYELFLDGPIKIRFRSIVAEKEKGQLKDKPSVENLEPAQKKKKVKERTIREARDYVAYWRHLYQQVDQNGKRIYTLESAATEVGLAKKTLDDYFYQLRQGEYFGFKFQEHIHEKIGVLRRFVRINITREQTVGQAVAPFDDIDRYLASDSSDEDKKYK